jgi:hypothetical protein
MHTCTQAPMHMHIRTSTLALVYTRTRAHTHTHTHTHTHSLTQFAMVTINVNDQTITNDQYSHSRNKCTPCKYTVNQLYIHERSLVCTMNSPSYTPFTLSTTSRHTRTHPRTHQPILYPLLSKRTHSYTIHCVLPGQTNVLASNITMTIQSVTPPPPPTLMYTSELRHGLLHRNSVPVSDLTTTLEKLGSICEPVLSHQQLYCEPIPSQFGSFTEFEPTTANV